MKKSKDEKKLTAIDYIDKATEFVLGIIKKCAKLSNSKKTHDTVFIFSKIIITVIIISIMYIPFDIFNDLGRILIYTFGSTFRTFFSMSWSSIIYISYWVISLIILLQVLNSILKNKELNFIEDNRRKDTALKKKIFTPIINLLNIFLYLSVIPFIVLCAFILVLLGALVALLVNGYLLFSGFIILIGILIMAVSFILAIIKLTTGGVSNE